MRVYSVCDSTVNVVLNIPLAKCVCFYQCVFECFGGAHKLYVRVWLSAWCVGRTNIDDCVNHLRFAWYACFLHVVAGGNCVA